MNSSAAITPVSKSASISWHGKGYGEVGDYVLWARTPAKELMPYMMTRPVGFN